MFDTLIIGLGLTGQSIVRYCQRTNQTCAVWEPSQDADTSKFSALFPALPIWQATLPEEAYDIPLWVLSPGIPLDQPEVVKAKRRGLMVTGDISLFAQVNTKPILAVTGSNGKSTVVSLLEKMVAAQDLNPALLGNIGSPALDGLEKDYDCVILELSSFQLDITEGLEALVSCILNISPDHLDRHGTVAAYTAAKQRIYIGAEHAVCNADDKATYPIDMPYICFSMKNQDPNQWHYDPKGSALCFKHKKYPVSRLPIHSEIHYANVLAALAIIHEAGYDTDKAFEAACAFHGLPHRLVLITEKNNIKCYNDSKATNVGAAIASIDSVAKLIPGRIVIILGGLSKGATFESLKEPLAKHARAAILLGEAKPKLEKELKDIVPFISVNNYEEAVAEAFKQAQPGDAILLAPACASWDMFNNYGERGDLFTRLVREQQSCTQVK